MEMGYFILKVLYFIYYHIDRLPTQECTMTIFYILGKTSASSWSN